MYLTPKVERFGTFRELTQIGLTGASDGMTVCGPNGTVTGCTEGKDCPTSGGHS